MAIPGVDSHQGRRFSFDNIDAKIVALENKISRGSNMGNKLRKDYLELAKLYSKKGDHDKALHYASTARHMLVFEGYEDQERTALHEANFLMADSLQSQARKAGPIEAKELYAKAFAKLSDESRGASGPLNKEYYPKLLKLVKEYQSRFPHSNIDKELPQFCKKKERSETVATLIEKSKPLFSQMEGVVKKLAGQVSNAIQNILPKPPKSTSSDTSPYSPRGAQFSEVFKKAHF